MKLRIMGCDGSEAAIRLRGDQRGKYRHEGREREHIGVIQPA
jgi:hypothetical protein